MTIIIQSPHQKISNKTRRIIEEKFEYFDRMYDRIENCRVVLKIEKNNKKDVCIVEARLVVPGNDLFAVERADKFPKAVDLVCIDLENQIRKFKGKLNQKRAVPADEIQTEQ